MKNGDHPKKTLQRVIEFRVLLLGLIERRYCVLRSCSAWTVAGP
jgi:hypothetical protein